MGRFDVVTTLGGMVYLGKETSMGADWASALANERQPAVAHAEKRRVNDLKVVIIFPIVTGLKCLISLRSHKNRL